MTLKENKEHNLMRRILEDWLNCEDSLEEWVRCRNNAKIVLGRPAEPKEFDFKTHNKNQKMDSEILIKALNPIETMDMQADRLEDQKMDSEEPGAKVDAKCHAAKYCMDCGGRLPNKHKSWCKSAT